MNNLKAFIRLRWKKDLFSVTHRRLTYFYTGLIMLFLIVFIVIVYSILHAVIINQQEKDLQSLIKDDVGAVIDSIIKNPPNPTQEEISVKGQDLFFYYILSADGRFITGDETYRELRPNIYNILKDWVPERNEIKYEEMKVTYEYLIGPTGSIQRSKTEDLKIMMTGTPIYFKNRYIGLLYIGKNMTSSFQLLKTVFNILIVIAAIFILVALTFSHFMSRRAMVPIKNAFTRQQEFVADASHELRTPLSVMLSSIDALQLEQHEEADLFSKRLLKNMKNEVRRMTRLVGDLLMLARSDAEPYSLQLETFNMATEAGKVFDSVLPLASEKQISINMNTPEEIILQGDKEKLTQLLYILLDNAVKYTPEGGKIHLSLSEAKNNQQKYVTLKVEDTGIGIHADELNRVFDRFYRADKARSRNMGGHGIGLSIAKWIVEAHNGNINVSSEISKGSSFEVMLPTK